MLTCKHVIIRPGRPYGPRLRERAGRGYRRAWCSPLFDAPQAWRTPERSEGRDALRPDRFRIP